MPDFNPSLHPRGRLGRWVRKPGGLRKVPQMHDSKGSRVKTGDLVVVTKPSIYPLNRPRGKVMKVGGHSYQDGKHDPTAFEIRGDRSVETVPLRDVVRVPDHMRDELEPTVSGGTISKEQMARVHAGRPRKQRDPGAEAAAIAQYQELGREMAVKARTERKPFKVKAGERVVASRHFSTPGKLPPGVGKPRYMSDEEAFGERVIAGTELEVLSDADEGHGGVMVRMPSGIPQIVGWDGIARTARQRDPGLEGDDRSIYRRWQDAEAAYASAVYMESLHPGDPAAAIRVERTRREADSANAALKGHATAMLRQRDPGEAVAANPDLDTIISRYVKAAREKRRADPKAYESLKRVTRSGVTRAPVKQADPSESPMTGEAAIEQLTHATRDSLEAKWSSLELNLHRHVGHPDDPEARAAIDGQVAIAKAIHRKARREGIEANGEGPRDVVIVGGGPAGLGAAIYGGTEGLDTLLIEASGQAGGQARLSSGIENVPGFPAGVFGQQFADDSLLQAQRVLSDTMMGVRVEAIDFDPKTQIKTLRLSDGKSVQARSVVLAGGVEFRKAKFDGADAEGIVYGWSDEVARQIRNGGGGDAVVVGGANSAGQAAVDLSLKPEVSHVTVLVRRGLRDKMSDYLARQLESSPKVTILERAEIGSVQKDAGGHVQSVKLKGGQELPARGVGLFIGSAPNCEWTKLPLDERGYLLTGEGGRMPLETAMAGVFAAGDVRSGTQHRVISAGTDGALAIGMAWPLVKKMRAEQAKIKADRRRAGLEEGEDQGTDEAEDWLDRLREVDDDAPYVDLEEDDADE